ncbi:phosphatidylinositol-specific phospholipase C domain-containing protein [Candidatus Weimeria sp. HCP3S3_B5]|uniref:phosphatidylinositol-specific phospholipase C domain-containing protein n=1 Tax=Candidatus Weimeria sp. HCP3S3_B5 TaxID=3438871 RepID=UPI003F8A1E2F
MINFFKEHKDRWLASLIVLILLIVCFANADSGEIREAAITDSKHYKPTAEWMRDIADDTYLSSISIPGTHDSAARYVFPEYSLRTQKMTIADQLTSGYRYLDIRLAIENTREGKRLGFVHNLGKCRKSKIIFSKQIYLDEVLDQIYAFLKAHPSETVLFCVKDENSNDKADEFERLLFNEIDKKPSDWYLDDTIPKLSSVRSRIVLLRRFSNPLAKSAGLDFSWEDQGSSQVVDLPYVNYPIGDNATLWVQDRYRYTVAEKEDAFTDMLENVQPDDSTFTLNFLSTTNGSGISHPASYASLLNEKLMGIDLHPNTSYGIIVVDFGTRQLAQHIYMTNYKTANQQ